MAGCFCCSLKGLGEDPRFLFYRLRSVTLLKKRLRQKCFPANFVKFSILTFLTELPRWLLLRCLSLRGKVLPSKIFCTNFKRNVPAVYHLSIRDVTKKREQYIHILPTHLAVLIKGTVKQIV